MLSMLLVWSMFAQTRTAEISVDDFVEYWAAVRLQLQGLNPYSPDRVLALERMAGMSGSEPLVMLNPPWTIVFLLPFGILNYPAGRVVWLILGLSLTILSARWLWAAYGGPTQSRGIPLALAFSFVPLLISLAFGQITPLILTGIAGFLYYQARSQPMIAGSCLVLMSFKPHLFYLFWIALLFWIIQQHCWRLLWGAVLGWASALAATIIWNPAVLAQYVEMTGKQAPALHWRTPTYGTVLRSFLGMEHSWLQFAPMVVGAAWLLYYWRSHRLGWEWSSQTPLLVSVSVTTTCYVWFFDQTLFLPAIIQVAALVCSGQAQKGRTALISFGVLNLVLILFMILKLPPVHYQWTFAAWLVWYLLYVDHKQRSVSQAALVCESGT